MNRLPIDHTPDTTGSDWRPFPGGELEGEPPRALCAACRARPRAAARHASMGRSPLCFQCYRVELERNRRLAEAAELLTASDARFQTSLPFEPVNTARLTRLRAERQQARTAARKGAGVYVEKRRRAQIEARHTLARIAQGLRERRLIDRPATRVDASTGSFGHTVADLQFPEAWLPFVATR